MSTYIFPYCIWTFFDFFIFFSFFRFILSFIFLFIIWRSDFRFLPNFLLQKLKILPDQNILFLWNGLTELEKKELALFLHSIFFVNLIHMYLYRNCIYTMYVQWDKGWFLWEYIVDCPKLKSKLSSKLVLRQRQFF